MPQEEMSRWRRGRIFSTVISSTNTHNEQNYQNDHCCTKYNRSASYLKETVCRNVASNGCRDEHFKFICLQVPEFVLKVPSVAPKRYMW